MRPNLGRISDRLNGKPQETSAINLAGQELLAEVEFDNVPDLLPLYNLNIHGGLPAPYRHK